MKIVSALGTPISLKLVDAARKDVAPTSEAVMNKAQWVSVENLAASISTDYLEEIKALVARGEIPAGAISIKLSGLTVRIDDSMDKTWIEFRDPKGNTLSRIESLAVPTAYFEAEQKVKK